MSKERIELRKYFIYTFAISWLVEGAALVLGWLIPGFSAALIAVFWKDGWRVEREKPRMVESLVG